MNEDPFTIIKQHHQMVFPFIQQYVSGKTLLDVGCGTGLNAYLFNQKSETLPVLTDVTDIRDERVSEFRFVRSSVDDLPFDDDSFDVIFLQYVLHHLPPNMSLQRVFGELNRIAETLIIVEEVPTDRTDLGKASRYDAEMNSIIHPHADHMKVYKYYSDTELKSYFSEMQRDILLDEVFDPGSAQDGYLQRRVYVLR